MNWAVGVLLAKPQYSKASSPVPIIAPIAKGSISETFVDKKDTGHNPQASKLWKSPVLIQSFFVAQLINSMNVLQTRVHLLYPVMYTLFFCKNVVFPAQAEYSYFCADFRLEIFLYYS